MATETPDPTTATATASTSCSATCGIGRERDRQKAAARVAAARAYPGLGWTPAPAWLPDEPPVPHDELLALAAALEDVLPTRAIVTAAEPGMAASVYLLGGLHAPCWLERLRDEVDPRAEPGPPRAEETYVRIAASALGRYVTLQEVCVAAPDGGGAADGRWVETRGVVGVGDRRLQLFVKATQGVLRKRKLVALDAVFLAEPTPDPEGTAAAALGASPTLWSLLVEPTPPGAVRGEWLALERTGSG
jgi:hypothetical protein